MESAALTDDADSSSEVEGQNGGDGNLNYSTNSTENEDKT